MKTRRQIGRMGLMVLVAIACLSATAQTNCISDEDGYVTNADYLRPFSVIKPHAALVTNAVMVKILPNEFFYKTSDGTEGLARWEWISPEQRAFFHYDPVAAAKADQMDTAKKAAQQINTERELAEGEKHDRLVHAYEVAMSKQATFYADVVAQVYDGLIIVTPGSYGEETDRANIVIDGKVVSVAMDTKIFLKHYPYALNENAIGSQQIHPTAFPIGSHSRALANGEKETLPLWTCDTNEAVRFYLAQ